MSILVDWEIEIALKNSEYPLVIKPLDRATQIQPASIDLRLGNTVVLSPARRLLDPHRGIGPKGAAMRVRDEYRLLPNEFKNFSILEYVEIPPGLVGKLEGKSSLARIGLMVEAAGYVDPGWKGHLTLELKNLGLDEIILRPGMKICQLRLYRTEKPRRLYGDPSLNSHYQGATEAQTGRFDPAPRAEPGTTGSAPPA